MATETKTDDLSRHELEERLLDSLREREGEATAGDVAADTGLPYDRVEDGLRGLLQQYKSHLDVDDDGNLRYRFDPSFVRRGENPGRWWYRFKKMAWRAFVGFFKIWTMVMLVGYTVVFVLLLISLSVAALTQDDEGGDLALLPFYFLGRMLETIFYIDIFTRFRVGRRARRMKRERKADKPDEPFYQKIFKFLFGPEAESDDSDPLRIERRFTRLVRARQGRITPAEWASRSGQSLEDADNALTGSLVRFQGDVDVTDDGAMVYRFDRLRVTADGEEQPDEPDPIWERRVSVPSLTGNPTSTNGWIIGLNGFNLVMASFFASSSAGTLTFEILLGWIPLVFSLLFFALPAVRWVRKKWREEAAQRENRRRRAVRKVYESVSEGEAQPVDEEEFAAVDERLAERMLGDYQGEIEVTDDGDVQYRFDDVARQVRAGRRARQRAGEESVVFGETVFSSDEDEKSIEESEMDEFDRRLARDLGEETTLEDLEEMSAETPVEAEVAQR